MSSDQPGPDPWLPSDSWATDTAPQQPVDLPYSPSEAANAAGDVYSTLLIRAVVAGVAAIALVVVAVLLFANGVRPNNFPAYVSGTTRTVITRYSGPWIGAAAGVALLAGLSLTSAGVDMFRRQRMQRAARLDAPPAGSPTAAG